MAALSWLLIPILGAVVAGAWGSWITRRRRPAPDVAGVAGYERFRAAMERSSREDGIGGGVDEVPEPAQTELGPKPAPARERERMREQAEPAHR